ncbi:hypothetical protein [Arcticibacter sp.]|uniref:hypothetical protein n=1 Tax=Arcticibacter sp. TaxID=1872630 RepID=UPI0038900917
MLTTNLSLYISSLKELRAEIAESDSEDYVINKINLIDYNLVMYDQVRHAECLSLITKFHIAIMELRNSGKLEKLPFLILLDDYIAKLPGLLPE